jgi:hypothetical protein
VIVLLVRWDIQASTEKDKVECKIWWQVPTLLCGSEPWFKNSRTSLIQEERIKILEV